MDKIKKVSRESELKSKDIRSKPWTPPSSLDAPPPPNGFCHRWLRESTQGYEDTGNMSKKLREGWELVRADELEKQIGPNDYPVISSGKHEGVVGVGGLLLARIPEELAKQRVDYQKRLTEGQDEAVETDLLREQHKSMPIDVDRQSRVTFGGTKKD